MQYQVARQTNSVYVSTNVKNRYIGVTKMVTLDFLRTVKLFRGLTDEELAEVKLCCKEVLLSGNSAIFEENDTADYLYNLVEGKVSIRYKLPHKQTDKEQTVTIIKPGETFGWSAFRPSGQYTLSAYCEGESCRAVKIKSDDLVALMERDHTIGYKVLKNLSSVIGRRFIALQNEIALRDGQDLIHGW